MVRWDPPKAADVPNYSIDYAITYAHSARRAYQNNIDQQSALSTNLSSGLIGLGGVVAALATFGAHRDTLIGAGLLGGTAYALGNWNYSKQRQLVYQAGVEGINCSIRAVTPLYMSNDELAALNIALGNIEVLVPQVLQSIAEAEAEQAKLPDGATKQDAQRQIANGRLIVDSANKALVSGRQLAIKVRRAGAELINAVDRIDAAVSKAALDTLPDLTSVPKVVAGLAGFAGIVSPGADTVVAQALKGALGSSQGGGVDLTKAPTAAALDGALRRLRALSEQLAAEVSKVAARLTGYDAALNTDALADCGIGNVSSGLRAMPDTITFMAGTDQTKRFVVSGGTKPYGSVLLDTLPEGLTVRNPAPFDSTFEVIATKAAKNTDPLKVMITDASSPYKSILVTVQVGTAAAGSGSGAAPATNSPTSIAEFATMIKGASFAMKDSAGADIKLSVDGAQPNKPNPTDIGLTITCEKAPKESFDAEKVRDALLNQQVKGLDVGASLRVLDPQGKNRIKFLAPDPACIKGGLGASQGGSVLLKRNVAPPDGRAGLSSEDVRKVQINLCLPYWLQTGTWASQTQRAFNEWRRMNSALARKAGDPVSNEEVKAILQADTATVTKWCAGK